MEEKNAKQEGDLISKVGMSLSKTLSSHNRVLSSKSYKLFIREGLGRRCRRWPAIWWEFIKVDFLS